MSWLRTPFPAQVICHNLTSGATVASKEYKSKTGEVITGQGGPDGATGDTGAMGATGATDVLLGTATGYCLLVCCIIQPLVVGGSSQTRCARGADDRHPLAFTEIVGVKGVDRDGHGLRLLLIIGFVVLCSAGFFLLLSAGRIANIGIASIL